MIYTGLGGVEVADVGYPTFELAEPGWMGQTETRRALRDAAIIRVISTNICGSDQHVVARGAPPEGLVLGHEITGEIVEIGPDVDSVRPGDFCSVPYNLSCGRCHACKRGATNVCLNQNLTAFGASHGTLGGQAEFVLVPNADWNLLRFPDKDQALEKILDLTMLSDVFPTGFHSAVMAGVKAGSTVYVAGAGPIGLAAAYSALLLGAAVVFVGDLIPERLEQARSFGCEPIDISKGEPREQIQELLGQPEVDAAVDAVGFEFRGHGSDADHEPPATVLNLLMDITRAGGNLGIHGFYADRDPGAAHGSGQRGSMSVRMGLGWTKSQTFTTGQCPVMRYQADLMKLILHDKAHIARAVRARVMSLDQAPQGYKDFEFGAATKYVLDPQGLMAA